LKNSTASLKFSTVLFHWQTVQQRTILFQIKQKA